MHLTAAVCIFLSAIVAAGADPAMPDRFKPGRFAPDPAFEARVDALLARMTLAEKIGQLRQGGWSPDFDLQQARTGIIGSLTNADDPHAIAEIQKAARASRLGIPILLTHNTVHGFRTLFPVPIGLAATFDPTLVETASKWAGHEASAVGLHWTLGPMVDVSRDPRWGRVVEGPGEDPYLASLMSAAQVRGFLRGGIMASLKHYVGYGAAEAGRDYNSTEISVPTLHDLYLPPFKAGVDAGAQSVMAAFNALNGTPATANKHTLTDILKTDWGFDGFVISDWDSVLELINHGHAADAADAARKAILSGLDVEMAGDMFKSSLAGEVAAGRVPLANVDEAVRRVLRVKFRMGLFDKPDPDPKAAAAELLTSGALAAARQAAIESFVLLKNDGDLLPIRPKVRRIAVVGGIADTPSDHMGSWGANGQQDDVVTTLSALKRRFEPSGVSVSYAAGCDGACKTTEGFAAATTVARNADLIVAVLGEPWYMTAEGTSRTRLGLPGRQQELLEALVATGKPVALVVFGGRPMTIGWAAEHVLSILYAWSPGTAGGLAMADVLSGDVSPSGKLPMTMPRAVGQIPIYYNHLPTGRPATDDHYSSKYIDEEVSPLYPFGYGLSYGRFSYANLAIDRRKVKRGETMEVSVDVTNNGPREGREAVQLYVHDLVGTKSRPIRELKAIDKITIAPGQTRRVSLRVPVDTLGFHLDDGRYVVETGAFRIYVGGSSRADLSASFDLEDN